MGRTIQWLKSLFGIKKGKKDKKEIPDSTSILKNPATIPPNITAAEAAWLLAADNRYAISVAAATATAAAAAAAAAELAVAAVKLTSNGALFVSRAEQMAAVKIQRTFRGFLGRKALKGLRAVVKLQALMRGILVRKQAKATLHGMEALIRVQNIVRAKKNQSRYQNFDHFHQSYHVQKVKGRHDDTRSEYITTPHSKRLSHSFDTRMSLFDEKPMVVGPGPGPGPTRPKSRSRRPNNSVSDYYNDNLFCQIHRNNLFRLSDSRNSYDQDWSNECRFSTAHSTPRFVHGPINGPYGPNESINGPYGPNTPANSVCGDDSVFFRNYMANTHSFRAKLRCQSAPRPRPDIRPKKRQSLVELMENRNSHSGHRMQRSCSQAQDGIAFKNAVMCKLDRSCDSGRGGEREFFPGRMA